MFIFSIADTFPRSFQKFLQISDHIRQLLSFRLLTHILLLQRNFLLYGDTRLMAQQTYLLQYLINRSTIFSSKFMHRTCI